MTPFSASVWLVIVLGAWLANLPFLTQRLFGFVSLHSRKKIALRLLELLLYYALLIITGMALENNLGQISPQGWEFYAITLALFFTLAFPGYVYCYLRRGRQQPGSPF